MIERDLGHTYLDEERWQVWDGPKAFTIAMANMPCVLQAPGLLKDVGRFGQLDQAAVVVMQRSLRDIILSQDRIGWNIHAATEMSHYPVDPNSPAALEPARWVAWIKYDWWDRIGKAQVKHFYEVRYEDLKSHPMWVKKEQRRDFNARQYRA
jgi:hypothetical protein